MFKNGPPPQPAHWKHSRRIYPSLPISGTDHRRSQHTEYCPGSLVPYWLAASAMVVTCSLRSGRQRAPWRDREKNVRLAMEAARTRRGGEDRRRTSFVFPAAAPHRDRSAVPAALHHSSPARIHRLCAPSMAPPPLLFTGTDPPPVCAFYGAAAGEKSEGEEEAAQWRAGQKGRT